jgi:protease II
MRDGFKLPVTLCYNKKLINSESPVVIHVNCDANFREEMAFTPEKLSILSRGLVYAYPHLRGKSKSLYILIFLLA